MSKTQSITLEEVEAAWKAVRRAGGGPGIDGKSIEEVEKNLSGEQYKIWNRMSSGSYQAQTVKVVMIPKAKGGMRALGVPTVTDRVAQTVVKKRLERIVDPKFSKHSYGYREGKSAIDAVMQARERCMRREYVLEIDIRSFFDNLDHGIAMEILKQHTNDSVIVLYTERFLKADYETEDGKRTKRERGTPQGGVVSPVLSNLYLHEAFDKWIEEKHPEIWFERYADDIVIHCVSEAQANYMKLKIDERLKQYKLELHSEKTKVVYTGKSNKHDHRKHGLPRKFTFLGYDFKPRFYKDKIVFTPGMGQGALARIGQEVKRWRLGSTTCESITEVAGRINIKVIGWINYYGHFRRSELHKLVDLVNKRLVKWLSKKHKIRQLGKAWDELKKIKQSNRKMFAHWYMVGSSTRGAV